MRPIHRFAATAAILTLIVILAACTGAAEAPSPSPSTPAPSQPAPSEPAPSADQPAPSESPSADPTASPTPVAVIEHDIPMVGRITEDGVEVRTHPAADAPLVTGESFTDPGTTPEVVLQSGDLVTVTLGPLVNEGESWYEVASVDGAGVVFAFGWVPADAFEADSDFPSSFPVIAPISGQGDGASVESDVILGTPVTVRYAAVPMAGEDECDIHVTVTATDGSAIEVASETLTEIRIEEISPFQVSELFQGEAGTVTLTVETDCSFAATMLTPPS